VKGAKSVGKRNGTKIIVSRSHAGDVQKVVQASLGNDASVEPAGGAGEYHLSLVRFIWAHYILQCESKKSP